MTVSEHAAIATPRPTAVLPSPISLDSRRRARTPQRDARLDALRIVAILAVVTIHTVSPVTAAAVTPRFSPTWWIGTTWNVVSLWCVPVFVMISGSLLLAPRDRPQPARDFYRRRLRRIGIPLVFWSTLYLVLRPTAFGEQLSASDALHDLAQGRPFLQMYYLFVIAGLYVVTPALRVFLARVGHARLDVIAPAVLGFNVLDYTLQSFAGVGGSNALTEWLPFLGYFLAGAWLAAPANAPLLARHRRLLPLAFAGSVVATLGLTAAMCAAYGWTSDGRYWLGYQSPTIVVMSLALFAWIKSRPARATRSGARRPAWIHRLGEATFGIFLVHPLFLVPLFLNAPRPHDLPSITLLVPAIVLAICTASAVLTLAMMRVPGVRRLVG